MRIAFLGLGRMGSAVARHLLEAKHELRVWNRTRARAEGLGKLGASVAEMPEEAVANADVVFTMVMDDGALEEVLYKGDALKGMMPGAVHVSLSTLSVALSERLTVMHRTEHLTFVAAPVFGRPNIAEEGKLATVVAGEVAPALLAQVQQFIDANRAVLLDYWEYRIDTDTLRRRLKSV